MEPAERRRRGAPAARSDRPRLDDVAALAGVSSGTVSLVLRNQPGPSRATRDRVLEVAGSLGYRADRSASLLARRRTYLLGVSMSLTNPFHAELVEDIHLAASDRGYERGGPHPSPGLGPAADGAPAGRPAL